MKMAGCFVAGRAYFHSSSSSPAWPSEGSRRAREADNDRDEGLGSPLGDWGVRRRWTSVSGDGRQVSAVGGETITVRDDRQRSGGAGAPPAAVAARRARGARLVCRRAGGDGDTD